MRRACLIFLAACCLFAPRTAAAHPVPNDNHDRTIVVRVTARALLVDYRIELDETRAARDLPRDLIARVGSPKDVYTLFTSSFARVFADNLDATLDGEALTFRCVEQQYSVSDHLRCDYRFEALWNLRPDRRYKLRLREGNYEFDDVSALRLRIDGDRGVRLEDIGAPGEALMNKTGERQPGEGERLRTLSAVITLTDAEPRGAYKLALPPELANYRAEPLVPVGGAKPPPSEGAGANKPWAEARPADDHPVPGGDSLLRLLLDTKQGLAVTLLLAVVLGAGHALTPGHGKTLVAAYLVGERGTAWHALLLGVVTTLTHTAIVIALAGVIFFYPPAGEIVLALQGLVGGLLITGLGLWLLIRRLSGGTDHVHLFGGHHHHHGRHRHGHADHTHDASGAIVPVPGVSSAIPHYEPTRGAVGTLVPPRVAQPRWTELVTLGIGGGIVPCVDAIFLLGLAITTGRFWLGLPLILAFSAGLAAVLVALGLSVVATQRVAAAVGGESERFRAVMRALPLVSAALITLIGLWLCVTNSPWSH